MARTIQRIVDDHPPAHPGDQAGPNQIYDSPELDDIDFAEYVQDPMENVATSAAV